MQKNIVYFILLASLGSLQLAQAAVGPEYLRSGDIDKEQPLEAAFREEPRRPFLEDQQWLLHSRTYYLERNTDNEPDQQALATGGWLSWESGYWKKSLQFGATAFTSQKVIGDKNKDGTGLLQQGQKSFSGVSEIYADVNVIDRGVEQANIRAGRFLLNAPYLNARDIRMVPMTFQGYRVLYTPNEHWTTGAGQFTHIKDLVGTNFDTLYERQGLEKDNTLTSAGARYQNNNHNGGFFFHHAPDFMETLYLEYSIGVELNTDHKLTLSSQYTHQQSIGNQLDGQFDVDHFGVKINWSTGPITTTVVHTYYSDTEMIRSPWGAIAGYTSMVVRDFNRPGERTWLAGIDVDFAEFGLPGFSADTNYIHGNTPDSGDTASPDEAEWDVTINYRLQSGPLENLWIRFRHVYLNAKNSKGKQDAQDLTDVRLIINHEWKF